MTTRRWWDLAYAAAAVGIAVICALNPWPPDSATLGAIVTMAVLIAGYYTFGRFTIGAQIAPWRPLLWCLTMIVLLCIGVAFTPLTCFMQAIIYPFIWVHNLRRRAILLNLVTGLAVIVGYLLNSGLSGLALGLVTAVLSVAASMAMGLWITKITDLGKERARLLDELTAAQGELSFMHREAGIVSERERLARDIHDTIAQSLTAQVMLAQRGRIELAAGASAQALDASLELLETGAREALDETRMLVTSLTPSGVGDGNLSQVITRLTTRFERETGVPVVVDIDSALPAAGLDRELEVVLLRCSQEGLANVRKHAAATRAALALSVTDSSVILVISDNGRGLSRPAAGTEPRSAGTGFGVSGMRDRVGLVEGSLDLSTAEAGGVELRITIPRVCRPAAVLR